MLAFVPFPLSDLHYLLGGGECIFACLYYPCIFLSMSSYNPPTHTKSQQLSSLSRSLFAVKSCLSVKVRFLMRSGVSPTQNFPTYPQIFCRLSLRIAIAFRADVDQGGSEGWPKNLRPCLSSPFSLDNNNVSPRTPQSVVGSVHRISMELRARFVGIRLSIHLSIIRGLHHCATRSVGHARKSISPFFTSIVKR